MKGFTVQINFYPKVQYPHWAFYLKDVMGNRTNNVSEAKVFKTEAGAKKWADKMMPQLGNREYKIVQVNYELNDQGQSIKTELASGVSPHPFKQASVKQASESGRRRVTAALDAVASLLQYHHESLGIPEKVANDFAYRCDLLSDNIEKQAGSK